MSVPLRNFGKTGVRILTLGFGGIISTQVVGITPDITADCSLELLDLMI